MRPWYIPVSYGVAGGPLKVKCQSNRSVSNGAAYVVGSGLADSSDASFSILRIVGDFAFREGEDMIGREVGLDHCRYWKTFAQV